MFRWIVWKIWDERFLILMLFLIVLLVYKLFWRF